MEATFSDAITEPFIVKEETIRNVHKILFDDFDTIKFSADCIDNTVRSFDEINELLSYHNTKGCRIIELHVEARKTKGNAYYSASVAWKVEKNNESARLRIRINGHEDVVMKLKSKLGTIQESTKPWYSSISKFEENQLFRLLILICIIFASAVAINISYPGTFYEIDRKSTEPVMQHQLWELIVVLIPLSILFGIILNFVFRCIILPVKRMIFPYGVILIGEERDRDKRTGQLRLYFLGALATTILGLLVKFVA